MPELSHYATVRFWHFVAEWMTPMRPQARLPKAVSEAREGLLIASAKRNTQAVHRALRNVFLARTEELRREMNIEGERNV